MGLVSGLQSKNQPTVEVETFNGYNLPRKFKNEFSTTGRYKAFPINSGAEVKYGCK